MSQQVQSVLDDESRYRIIEMKYGKARADEEREKDRIARITQSKGREYANILEHMIGAHDMVAFLGKALKDASGLKMRDNVAYLDALASRHFYIGHAFSYQFPYLDEKGERQVREYHHHPFLSCQYDFIHQIEWKKAYVFGNYLYLLSDMKKTNSPLYKNISHFTLAVYADNPDKWEAYRGHEYLDFRKLSFDSVSGQRAVLDDKGQPLLDEDGDRIFEEYDQFVLQVNDKKVERTVSLEFLTRDNAYRILEYNQKAFTQAKKAYLEAVSGKVDERMAKLQGDMGQLYGYFDLNTGKTQDTFDYVEESRLYDQEHGSANGLVYHNGKWVTPESVELDEYIGIDEYYLDDDSDEARRMLNERCELQ